MIIDKLHVYRKGLKVERMHTVQHIMPYNNGFHSCNAALVAHELCLLNGLNSASTILYMLLHDVAEGYVGDSPANVKRDYPDIKRALDMAEYEWEQKHIPDMPDLHSLEKKIAKIADLSELGMYCIEELWLGNKNVTEILVRVVEYLHDFKDVKGTIDFIEHFVSRGEL